MEMTKASLLEICKVNKLYRTPALNDKLYCNFKGYTRISNLEPYTALKALFLEGNALDSFDGLPYLEELKCLYMQQNCITAISHLDNTPNLDTLNVSSNPLASLEGLEPCQHLQTLIATHCKLSSMESVAPLLQCPSIQTLDLAANELKDPEVLSIFKNMPNLRCLYLAGNPMVSQVKNYRKVLISAIPSLTYLDDRPVFEVERRCAEAWAVGGLEAEREARAAYQREQDEAQRRNFEALQAIRREGWRKRRAALGLAPGDTDPALDDLSDEEWVVGEEPPELEAARSALAAYTARDGEEELPELSRARHQLVRDGKPVQAGVWGGQAQAEADGSAYLESVRERQREMAREGGARSHASSPSPAAKAATVAATAAAAAHSDLGKSRDQVDQQEEQQEEEQQEEEQQEEEQQEAAAAAQPAAEAEAAEQLPAADAAAASPVTAAPASIAPVPSSAVAEPEPAAAGAGAAQEQAASVELPAAAAPGLVAPERSLLHLDDITVEGVAEGGRQQQQAAPGLEETAGAAVRAVLGLVADSERAAAAAAAGPAANAVDLFELD